MEVDNENADPVVSPRLEMDLTGDPPDATSVSDVQPPRPFESNRLSGVQPETPRPIDVDEYFGKSPEVENEVIVFVSLIGMCEPVSGVKPGINGVKPDLCLPFIL